MIGNLLVMIYWIKEQTNVVIIFIDQWHKVIFLQIFFSRYDINICLWYLFIYPEIAVIRYKNRWMYIFEFFLHSFYDRLVFISVSKEEQHDKVLCAFCLMVVQILGLLPFQEMTVPDAWLSPFTTKERTTKSCCLKIWGSGIDVTRMWNDHFGLIVWSFKVLVL